MADKFLSKSAAEKSALPKGMCKLPVLSNRYSTLPPLKSLTACIQCLLEHVNDL